MLHLQEHFRSRKREFTSWFINTDGAASHFKQRFTFFSVFNFMRKSKAKHFMWETCAPGHGKGPWDGIGAVVKRLLRNLEKHGLHDPITGKFQHTVYCKGAFDVYNTLARHSEMWRAKIGSKVMINEFVYHYIPGKGEDVSGAVLPEQVLQPISRPKNKPLTDPVPEIRSHFCFDFIADGLLSGKEINKVRYRRLSCHCEFCIGREWSNCANKTTKWKSIGMKSEATSSKRKDLKSRKVRLSDLRRAAARVTTVGEIVALESKNDEFSFWLARVVEPAKPAQLFGSPSYTEKGVKIVQGNYYIKVKIIDRFPADSSSQFRLPPDQETWNINAEGVVLRNVELARVVGVQQRVRTRSHKKLAQHEVHFELPAEELRRCTDAAEEKLDADGAAKHFDRPGREPNLARNRIG
jgi:hypothetical protein